MKKGDLIKLKVEKMINKGYCLGRLEGKVVFINNCLPDEHVHAKVVKIRKDYIEAVAIEIIEPSSFRISPKCEYFGLCGGCKLQDITYEKQLEIKQNFVEDDFIRIGKISNIDIPKPLQSERIYFYRNKMEYSFGKRWLIADINYTDLEKNFALGLHVTAQYEKVINLENCYLQSEFSNKIRNFIGDFLFNRGIKIHSLKNRDGLVKALAIRESYHTNEKMVNLITTRFDEKLMIDLSKNIETTFPEVTTFVNSISDPNISSTIPSQHIVLLGKGYILEKLDNFEFEIYPDTFFQTNTPQAEKLFSIVREDLEKNLLRRSDKKLVLLDLFSGVGVIGIIFSKIFDEIICFEEIEQSVISARRNADRNNVKNIKFVQQNLYEGLKVEQNYFENEIILIVDPPRAGLNQKIIHNIKKIKPSKIYYISCNPATQARDISLLIDEYKIISIQPVDMFPQTYHIENLVILEKI